MHEPKHVHIFESNYAHNGCFHVAPNARHEVQIKGDGWFSVSQKNSEGIEFSQLVHAEGIISIILGPFINPTTIRISKHSPILSELIFDNNFMKELEAI